MSAVPVDDYVLDTLMRDLVGHDRRPSAFLVYLYLWLTARDKLASGDSTTQTLRPTAFCAVAFTGLTMNLVTLYLQGYAGEITEFARACLENRSPAVTIDDGVAAMRMVEVLAKGESGTFQLEH